MEEFWRTNIMRRKDREKDTGFALEVLRDCEYATLATINPNGTPYCIPISPILVNNSIYFHCAMEGKKLDNIGENSCVCVSCVRHTKLIPEKFTTEFESTVAVGTCSVIHDNEEKIMALRVLCEKYASSNKGEFDHMIAHSLTRTAICRIDIEQLTGKANI